MKYLHGGKNVRPSASGYEFRIHKKVPRKGEEDETSEQGSREIRKALSFLCMQGCPQIQNYCGSMSQVFSSTVFEGHLGIGWCQMHPEVLH